MNKSKVRAPLMLAVIVFLSGALNIYSAFFVRHPLRMEILQDLLPLRISHASRTLTILTGFFLIFLAFGLSRRKYRAWLVSVIILLFSLIFHLVKGLDYEEAVFLLLPLALLWMFRLEFTVRSATQRLYKRVSLSLAVLAILFFYSTAGFFLLQGQFTAPVTSSNIYKDYEYSIFGIGNDTLVSTTRRARWFEDSITVAGIAALLSIITVLFSPEIFKDEVTEEQIRRAKELVLSHGNHPVSYLSLMDDKRYFFSASNNCLVAFKIRAGTAVVLGDPIGPPENEIKTFCAQYYGQMQQQGLTTVFYLASEPFRSIYKDLGLKMIKIGEDAVIDTQAFDLNTPEMKNVRNGFNSIKRKSVNFTWHNMQDLPWSALTKIQYLYADWLKTRKSSSMTFSMDFFPFPPDSEGLVLTAFDAQKNLVGAFSFFPFKQGQGMTLDLMVRSQNSPSGLVDAAVVEAINHFKESGVKELSLGLATASFSGNPRVDSPLSQRAVDFLYKNINAFYNYQSLANYKTKFNPVWQPRYLAYPSDAELPKIVLALAQVHASGGILGRTT